MTCLLPGYCIMSNASHLIYRINLLFVGVLGRQMRLSQFRPSIFVQKTSLYIANRTVSWSKVTWSQFGLALALASHPWLCRLSRRAAGLISSPLRFSQMRCSHVQSRSSSHCHSNLLLCHVVLKSSTSRAKQTGKTLMSGWPECESNHHRR